MSQMLQALQVPSRGPSMRTNTESSPLEQSYHKIQQPCESDHHCARKPLSRVDRSSGLGLNFEQHQAASQRATGGSWFITACGLRVRLEAPMSGQARSRLPGTRSPTRSRELLSSPGPRAAHASVGTGNRQPERSCGQAPVAAPEARPPWRARPGDSASKPALCRSLSLGLPQPVTVLR